MTAREYLKQSFYINKEIDENILQLEELDSDICRCTQIFTDMPPGVHNDNNAEIKLAAYIDKHDELTQKDVAKMMGISQSYISRLEKKIIKKLRNKLNYNEIK